MPGVSNWSGRFDWFGQAALWDAWKGTNAAFDQSVNSATNNDTPIPINSPRTPPILLMPPMLPPASKMS